MNNVELTTPYRRNKVHPLKFALWIGIASIVMMFVSLTSAYIVRQASGNWVDFKMPTEFFISTTLIILSSIALHISYKNFKQGNAARYKTLLLIATVLGIAFLVFQYKGWIALGDLGLSLKTNASGDFVYALTTLHAAHLLGGIAALSVALLVAFSYPFKITQARSLRFEITLIYWHFVDLLWIAIFIFILLMRP